MSTIRHRRAEFSVILVLAASAAAWGQPPGGGQAESGKKKPAVPPNVVIERDVRYGEADDHALLLDIVRPTEPSEQPRPVIAFIHGGAWSGGNKEILVGPLVPFAASGDYFCVSIEYRLSGVATLPAQIHDCKAAIRWLRAKRQDVQHRPGEDRCLGELGRWPSGEYAGRLRGRAGAGRRLRNAGCLQPCGLRGPLLRTLGLHGAGPGQGEQAAGRLRPRVQTAGWSHRRESGCRPVGFAGQLRLETRLRHADRSRHR